MHAGDLLWRATRRLYASGLGVDRRGVRWPAVTEPGFAHLWALDPSVVFLNHGSFGACPSEVLRQQAVLRAEMEAEPVRFLSRELDDRLDVARAALASFLGADPDDLAFVTNATSGVNAVLRSLTLAPGDELLTTDHAYNACKNALEFVAGRSGARVVIATVPFPVASPDAVIEAVLARVTSRTRLALVDHVTSPTALVLPVERLIAELSRRGIDVIVDGAHAPGMVPLDLGTLGATYYSGNCHKWLCAPKGSAFLWVRRDRHADVHPLTISHGANARRPGRERFRLEFDWTGTSDPTAWLTVPKAIAYVGGLLPGGWPAVMARNHALAIEARRQLCDVAGTPPPCPDTMIGSLASIVLPDGPTTDIFWRNPDPLQGRLFDHWKVEVPVMSWPSPPRRLVRISAQLYNERAHYARLAEALGKEIPAERR
jgi:isopenicillin-N epimerase